jgi:hypothetical protein
MLPRFDIRNGTIVDIAFPCFYLDVIDEHDTKYHDHKGWPSPTHPDHICQYPGSGFERIDFDNPHPINLTSEYEGYDEAIVVMDETVPELQLMARIDEEETNVVYLRAKASFDMFEDEPKEYRFTLFVHAPARVYRGKQEYERLDQVVRGIIVVLPGNKI